MAAMLVVAGHMIPVMNVAAVLDGGRLVVMLTAAVAALLMGVTTMIGVEGIGRRMVTR